MIKSEQKLGPRIIPVPLTWYSSVFLLRGIVYWIKALNFPFYVLVYMVYVL